MLPAAVVRCRSSTSPPTTGLRRFAFLSMPRRPVVMGSEPKPLIPLAEKKRAVWITAPRPQKKRLIFVVLWYKALASSISQWLFLIGRLIDSHCLDTPITLENSTPSPRSLSPTQLPSLLAAHYIFLNSNPTLTTTTMQMNQVLAAAILAATAPQTALAAPARQARDLKARDDPNL